MLTSGRVGLLYHLIPCSVINELGGSQYKLASLGVISTTPAGMSHCLAGSRNTSPVCQEHRILMWCAGSTAT